MDSSDLIHGTRGASLDAVSETPDGGSTDGSYR